MSALQKFSTRRTPQSEPLPGQVPNSSGGNTWLVTDTAQLRRFLILGTDGGTFYITERELTRQNAQVVIDLVKNGLADVVLREIYTVSTQGLAPRNDQALFALAIVSAFGSVGEKREAFKILPKIARTGTHLFQFVGFMEQFRGWGRIAREGVAGWYNRRDFYSVAHQVAKYRQRGGWSHLDVLRLCHDTSHPEIYEWIKTGDTDDDFLSAVTEVRTTQIEEVAVSIIRDFPEITWEMVNPDLLGSQWVWDALLQNMPMTATIRNLGRMTANGTLSYNQQGNSQIVCQRLRDPIKISASRVHPLQVLLALRTYASGGGHLGKLNWTPIPQILDALNDAFYLSFKNVEATGQRYLIGLDVSGSMSYPVATGLSARDASAAMAMSIIQSEDWVQTIAFSDGIARSYSRFGRGATVTPFPISRSSRLDEVVDRMNMMDFGGTDCSLPMRYALQNELDVDTFVIFTDNETWYGDIHPSQALQMYREQRVPDAKLIVVAMVGNRYSIADPEDAGMIDLVGFDSSLPQLISNFSRGEM